MYKENEGFDPGDLFLVRLLANRTVNAERPPHKTQPQSFTV